MVEQRYEAVRAFLRRVAESRRSRGSDGCLASRCRDVCDGLWWQGVVMKRHRGEGRGGLRRSVTRVAGVLLTLGALAGGSLIGAAPALAHQPVTLDSADRTPARGPLLVDGTVSFAVYTTLDGPRSKRGFRVGMQAGQSLQVQLLIVDAWPANALGADQLPTMTVVSPTGHRFVLKPRERTPFYEPYSKTSFLYLARLTTIAVSGTYRIWVSGHSSSTVRTVVGVGYREVPGTVRP